jgi:co-chaperonin GroES (HSP10)
MNTQAIGDAGTVSQVGSSNTSLTELELQRRQKIAKQEKELADLEAALPKPVGYMLLIALPDVEETFEGSDLVKANQTVKEETILASIGLVLDMGSQAYVDPARFPSGPWCAPGDYVMFRPNTGTRFRIGRKEYRLMNDDSVQAVVPQPKLIARA